MKVSLSETKAVTVAFNIYLQKTDNNLMAKYKAMLKVDYLWSI